MSENTWNGSIPNRQKAREKTCYAKLLQYLLAVLRKEISFTDASYEIFCIKLYNLYMIQNKELVQSRIANLKKGRSAYVGLSRHFYDNFATNEISAKC